MLLFYFLHSWNSSVYLNVSLSLNVRVRACVCVDNSFSACHFFRHIFKEPKIFASENFCTNRTRQFFNNYFCFHLLTARNEIIWINSFTFHCSLLLIGLYICISFKPLQSNCLNERTNERTIKQANRIYIYLSVLVHCLARYFVCNEFLFLFFNEIRLHS